MAHHVDDVAAARKQDALLTVGREDHVALVQRHRAGDGNRLLARRLHVEAHLALTLQLQHAVVIGAGEHHVAQALAQHVRLQLGIPVADGLVVVIEHTDQAERQVARLHTRYGRVGTRRLTGSLQVEMGEVGRVAGPDMRRRNMEAGFVLCHGLSLN